MGQVLLYLVPIAVFLFLFDDCRVCIMTVDACSTGRRALCVRHL